VLFRSVVFRANDLKVGLFQKQPAVQPAT